MSPAPTLIRPQDLANSDDENFIVDGVEVANVSVCV
jgi:hypothetical protein